MSTPQRLESLFPARQRQGFPVMAGALPGLGHALSLHLDAVGALARARATLGPLFWVNLGFGNWYLFCSSRSSFELLRHPAVVNAGARASLEYILGRSLLASDGPEHRRVRTAMNPIFSPRGLAESGSGARIAEVVSERAARWRGPDAVRVHRELGEMTLDLIFRVTGVGTLDLPVWRRQYNELLLGLMPIPWDLPGLPRRRALRAAAWINAEIAALLSRARQGGAAEGIAGALTRAVDEAGQPLSDAELVDNIRLLFLAGHETTASTTAWAVLELAQAPALWERLVAEARAGAGVPTSLQEARAFPFCEAVFRESVRLYGPAWFIERRTTAELQIDGQTVPAGTIVALPPASWSRDPELYPEPDRFLPDRWLDRASIPPIDLSAFGGGAHFCLGYHLAWQEVVAFLVALGREMGDAGLRLRPAFRGPLRQRWLPMPHPPASAAVRFEAS